MKQFPRIYSLCTLGIRHHQKFDYKFHPFRTDFLGDSGCGKSMIADMLQLIFVGSEVWLSPTESTTPRTVDGMVLKTTGRGTEIGYAILNIQTSPSEFVVIGTYLESSNGTSQAFIIQKGFEEEVLLPFAQPLNRAHFIKNKKILPLDELKRHLESQDLICTSFHHKKKFHRILYHNKLLSFDLSENDKLLKDYALIIQSFSRGKALELTDSDSLKSFLFGNSKAKELNRQFKLAIQELQTAVNEYGNNRAEINLIVQKQKDILELQDKKASRDDAELKWLLSNCVHYYQQENFLFIELKEAVKSNVSARQYLDAALNVIGSEIEECKKRMPETSKLLVQARDKYEAEIPDYARLKNIKQLLEKLAIPPDQLREKNAENILMLTQKNLMDETEAQMKKAGIWELFKKNDSFQTNASLLDSVQTTSENLIQELNEKQLYLAFADIKDKSSVGYWALMQHRSLSKEEESVIMHFKGIKTTKPAHPKPGARYMPRPENLLKELSITEPDDKGFWLQLRGIKEYVEQVDKQSFTKENLKNLHQIFESVVKDLRISIENIKTEIDNITQFRDYILGNGRFNDYLIAYRNKEAICSYKYESELNISEEEIRKSLLVLENGEEIEENYRVSYDDFANYQRLEHEIKNYLSQLMLAKAKLPTGVGQTYWSDRAESIIKETSPSIELIEGTTAIEREMMLSLNNSNDKMLYLSHMIDENHTKLNGLDVERKWEKYQNVKQQKQEAWREYWATYLKEPDSSTFSKEFQSYPLDKKTDFEVAQRLFGGAFKEIIEKYRLAEAYKFENNLDIVELSRVLLPEAFKDIEINEEAVIDAIARHLNSINEKNRELSKRKLQRIQDLLDQVRDEISSSIDFAKKIDLFFNSQEREITGGYRARLKLEYSKRYPKQWIDVFTDKLQQEGTLFQDLSFTEQLIDSVSMQEKLLNAFHICGGNTSVNSVEKLLDPNSYIDLFFSMESKDRGQSNKGSTGQTYTAVALLCIARLSLINKEAGSKHQNGIRFMPIDEAEGLGSNYDMLSRIAKEYDYQIISLSINPLGNFRDGEQYLYMLHKNTESEYDVNNEPFEILCESDKIIS